MGVAAKKSGFRIDRLTFVGALILCLYQTAQAQVGISSQATQVTLVAQVVPEASILGVTDPRETGRSGSVRETSTTVRLSANTGYRLIVRRVGAPASRIWVRAATGEYQELAPGSSVTVIRDPRVAGEREREIRYRVESPAEEPVAQLPVRYDLAIEPSL